MKNIILFLFFIPIFLFANIVTLKCDNNETVKISKKLYNELDVENCKLIQFQDKNLLFYYLDGMVNECGFLLKSNHSKVYSQYFLNFEVCNIQINQNILISSYRDKAKWKYQYFYINKQGKLAIINFIITKKNILIYNNIAYYLQKQGANKEAIYLLEKILEKYPNRVVAHYNIADAYWAIGKKDKAIKHYKIYIELMKQKGKEEKIPKEVLDRVL